ncbi:MAG: hypothetical protein NW200_12920 [Hyphomonadaceae bacterium]|nr:hypothetical protein [Hyphomonadaceae bacterium]
MKTAALVAVLGAFLIAAVVAIVYAWSSAGVEISLFGWVVIGLGAVVSVMLGGGLMALSFFSARQGFDDRVDHTEHEN